MVNQTCKPTLTDSLLTCVNMNTLIDRLSEAMADAQKNMPSVKINQSWLARQVKISTVSISKWFSGATKKIDADHLISAAKALNVSIEWLATGKGPKEPVNLGPAIQTPLRPVRAIDNPDEIEHDVFTIPRYSVQPSMGAGEPVMEVDEEGEPNYMRRSWARRRGLDTAKLFTVVATGDSMEPAICDGASVTIFRQPNLVNSKMMMLCYRNQCYIKRVLIQADGSVVLRSDNRADYKDIEISHESLDDLHVVGLVVNVSHDVL